ncbi:MAG: molybdopterin-dependent oxidoreductase [Coriobacteriia bacterium]
MPHALITRREWLAFVAALVPTLALAGCTFEPNGSGEGGGGSTETTGTELGSYQGQTLDPYRTAKIQGVSGIPQVKTSEFRLEIAGEVAKELSYTYDEVRSLPASRRLVTLPCVEGWSVVHVWDGFSLRDLLEQAQPSSSAVTVIFHCADGYTTSLPLQVVIDEDVLLAWAVNGVVLPAEYGFPLRAVAENRLGYKWAKWVTRVELSEDENYRGYWERRGYSNSAEA